MKFRIPFTKLVIQVVVESPPVLSVSTPATDARTGAWMKPVKPDMRQLLASLVNQLIEDLQRLDLIDGSKDEIDAAIEQVSS